MSHLRRRRRVREVVVEGGCAVGVAALAALQESSEQQAGGEGRADEQRRLSAREAFDVARDRAEVLLAHVTSDVVGRLGQRERLPREGALPALVEAVRGLENGARD